jgi:hypothetical protein
MKFEVVIVVQTRARSVDFKGQIKSIAQLASEEMKLRVPCCTSTACIDKLLLMVRDEWRQN